MVKCPFHDIEMDARFTEVAATTHGSDSTILVIDYSLEFKCPNCAGAWKKDNLQKWIYAKALVEESEQ